MIHLIVKGNREQAESAAHRFDVAADFSRETGSGESCLWAAREALPKIINWYAEDSRLGNRAPYPAGSLLLYSDHG